MEYAPIDRFCDRFGFQRTTTYRLIGNGTLRAVKVGKRTLIDVQAASAWLASLPAADIRYGRKAV